MKVFPKIIITGCPRSGTYYMSDLFTRAGISMGHECFYGLPGHGTWRQNMIGDVSWLAAPFLERDKDKRLIIHIVRNPLKQISSLMSVKFFDEFSFHGNLYTLFVEQYLPDIRHYDILDRYIVFWLRWNQMINRSCDGSYRLEDIVKNPYEIFETLKHEVKGKLPTKKKNSYKGVKYLKLEDLKDCKHYPNLVEIMKKYKYI